MEESVGRRARRLGGGAVAAAAVLGLLVPAVSAAAEPSSQPSGRAAILFLPWDDRAGGDPALLARLGERRRGLAVGLTSPTVGGYAPEQFLLDMGQGARVPLGLYGAPVPSLGLAAVAGSGEERIAGWAAVRARARRAPAKLEPGLLGAAVGAAGRRLAYLGPAGAPAAEAAVAADRAGRVAASPRAAPADFPARLRSLWRRADLLVARLPDGQAGLASLDGLLAVRSPRDLVYVVHAPPPAAPRPPLLATAIAGPGFAPAASFGSATTRRDGLVAATDVAPTVLARLGIPVPPSMQGRPLEAREDFAGAAAAARLHDRLLAVLPTRIAALVALLVVWLAAWGLFALARERADGRSASARAGGPDAGAGIRLGLLAAMWLPAVALVTAGGSAAVRVSAPVEGAAIALGSLAMAGATDRLAPWPRGPALPAGAALCAYAVDLALGSPLTSISATGPNPAAGARFFGVGNELETLLSVSILIGTGAALSGTRPSVRAPSPRTVAAAFAVAGVAGVAIMAPGRLGADVGAAITLGAGTAVAVGAILGRAGRRVAIAGLVLAPVAALGAVVLLDVLTGGDAHLSRTVLSDRPGAVLDAVERRAGTQLGLLASPAGAAVAAIALAALGGLALARRRLLAPLRATAGEPFAAGLAGAFAAVVVGALANDSATDMLAIGAALGLLAGAYVRARPEVPSPRTRAAPAVVARRA